MRYDFVYENSNGEKINLSKLPYKINIEPLIDYSWSYKTKQRQLGNKIVGFFKDIKDSTATLHVLAATVKERDEAIDYFNNVIEKDIYYGTAGKLWLGDWYTYAFITASKNSKWQYDAGIVKKEITISKEADSWYHITRSANYGEQEESTVYIAEDYIKTYESSGVDNGIKSLVANIVPKQSGSGTPSPENIRPISGWTEVTVFDTGVNVWDEEWENGYISSAGQHASDPTAIRSKNFVRIVPNTTYYGKSPVPMGIRFYDENQTSVGTVGVNNATFTTPSNAQYLKFYCANTATYNNDISINYPSTDHDYHAYTATTHTTDLGRTVYGGTVDVVSGTLTVDKLLLNKAVADMNNSDSYPGWTGVTELENIEGVTIGENGTISDVNGNFGTVFGYNTTGTNRIVYLPNSAYGMTQTQWQTNFPNDYVQFVVPLATPTTYTLTPQTINTLSGVNNVWVDSGDVTVTFRDDHGDIQTESGSIVSFEKKNALSGSGYDYAYDYMHDAQSQKIIANAGSIPCDFIITIQGYADSPIITIGDNTYAVNVEVPYGANLVIDSTQKTVIITLADGTKINAFGARDPDYYLFERIESGKNAVTWDGSYLWELLMIEERSEPRWLTD